MNTEWLHEYIVFARHLNFSSAAKALNMAQPTLSKHMIALEKWVGVPLIDRGGNCNSPITATVFSSALNRPSPR